MTDPVDTTDIPIPFESEAEMTDTTTPTETPATDGSAEPSTQPAKKEPRPLESELTHLAEFIGDRTNGPCLGRHIYAHLWVIAEEHDVWAGNCRNGHYFDDVPCDEYERALSLGIAWMKDHIEQLEIYRLENPS